MDAELDFPLLYRAHGAALTRAIERMVGTGGPADDLLQDTFVTAFRRRHDYDPARAAPETWLYGVALNLCRRHLRTRRRFFLFRERLTQVEPVTNPERPDDALDRRRRARVVDLVLQRLPRKQREVFTLYEIEGLDGSAIAQALQIPEGTVWTRLHHARLRFRSLLKKQQAKEQFP